MKDKFNTKNKITDAMYKLIGSEGYEKASMGKICDSIGITKAAAYYYFKSKEDIFLEIVKKIYQNDDSKFIDDIYQSTNKEEYQDILLKFGYGFIEMYEQDSELRKICYEIDIQTYRIPQIKEIVTTSNQELNDLLIKTLEKGVALHLFENHTINMKSQYMQILMTGLDKAILFDYPLNAKEVWKYSINRLFLKEEA